MFIATPEYRALNIILFFPCSFFFVHLKEGNGEERRGEGEEGRGEHVWQYVSKREREQESKRAREQENKRAR